MFEAKITIETPSLSQALNRLADAMAYPAAHAAPLTVQPTPMTPPALAPAAPTAAPMTPPPAPAPVSSVPPAPETPPLASAPSYTLEQISRAGADFITANPGKYQETMTLFGQFGISTMDQLKPEQYGAFATALRGLGAKL